MSNYKFNQFEHESKMGKILVDSQKKKSKHAKHEALESKRSEKKEHKSKKPFYTRANGEPETKKEYYKRHWSDLSKHENN